MSITLRILKRAADGRPTLYATRELDLLPITIGRDASCTIALEDPNKHMSRFHVQIEQQDGAYWMSVVSKVNPVMVKGRRYGPGTRLTLHSGDSFDLAEYEVQVLVPEETPAAQPEPEQSSDAGERLFNEATFLGGEGEDKKQDKKQDKTPEPPPEATYVPAKKTESAAAPSSHPLRAFFEGAGLARKELSPAQVDQMLRDCGAILRAAIEGIMMLLLARAEARKEFQADERPAGGALDNNPLKRMSAAGQAMDFLFDSADRTEGLLEPVQAIGDACEDLRAHQRAVIAGMRDTVLAALRHFDPHELERAYDQNSKGFSLANRKAKLWELFVAQHEKLTHAAQEDFNKVFGRDFVSAYQAELRRLKGGR